jgi:hypothetical protein
MSTSPDKITLRLTPAAVEVILAGLGELPHKHSHQTITDVVTQARAEMAPPAELVPDSEE